ncbi:type III secretion system cytoplasmic ring protein SctQ [Pseudomonas sp. LRF_L74]|uniref:type III secretion system cytoplasmic ring protein SctQ n=1 Tax=Pseudomonas sp. LRF_L74 TaxID=3369422 RepID=UPI003F62068E
MNASISRLASLTDELPEYSTAQAAALNRLRRAYAPMRVDLAGHPLPVRLDAGSVVPASGAALALPLQVDGCPAQLHLDSAACALLRGDGMDWSMAPAHLRGLLLEAVALDAVQTLEARLGSVIGFPCTSTLEAIGDPVTLGFVIGEREAMGWIVLGGDLARRGAIFDELPLQPRALAGLPLSASLQAGWQRLNLADLRSLRAGDVLMLERDYRLNIHDRLSATCHAPDGRRVRLSADFIRSYSSEEPAMSARDSFDDLPVRLVCEVGRVEIPLGELRSMGEGSVLDIGGELANPVRLMANGHCVGRGELVKLGSGLGVRVTSFADE